MVGHKVACAKLKNDINLDQLLQRIKAEFAIGKQFESNLKHILLTSLQQVDSGPQELKVVPDEEFDKMVRATRQSNVPIVCAWSANGELGPNPLANA